MCDKPLDGSEASCALIDEVIEESLITSVGCVLSISGAGVASARNGASAASEHATAAVSVGVFFMIVSFGGVIFECRRKRAPAPCATVPCALFAPRLESVA